MPTIPPKNTWVNPIALKLKAFISVQYGVVTDAVEGIALNIGSGVTVSGDSILYDGTSNATISAVMLSAVENPTFIGRFKYNVTNTDQSLFSINSSASFSELTAWADTSGGLLRTRIWAGAGAFGPSGGLTPSPDWHNWGGTAIASGNTASTWHNGVETITDSNIGSRDWEIEDDLFVGYGGSGRYLNGEIEFFALWGENLSDAEIVEFNDDPFAIFDSEGGFNALWAINSNIVIQ